MARRKVREGMVFRAKADSPSVSIHRWPRMTCFWCGTAIAPGDLYGECQDVIYCLACVSSPEMAEHE